MAPFIVLAIAALVGIGGVAVASDNARPGDLLYPVDTAVEEIRLAVAGDERRAELRTEFEREREDERRGDDVTSGSGQNNVNGNITSATEIEADVFTNETVVKIETNSGTEYFTTDANNREAVIDAIVNTTGLSRMVVESRLSFEIEDRASRTEDKTNSSGGDSDESVSDESGGRDNDNDSDNSGSGADNSGRR